MTRSTLKRVLATTVAIAAGMLAVAVPAGAHERDPRGFLVDGPFSVHDGGTSANGIIAILIGFTPPIGTDKGSFARN
jgi:hypothetical protein